MSDVDASVVDANLRVRSCICYFKNRSPPS